VLTSISALRSAYSAFADADVEIGIYHEHNATGPSPQVDGTANMTARPVNRTPLGSGGQMGIGESIMMQEKARYEECKYDEFFPLVYAKQSFHQSADNMPNRTEISSGRISQSIPSAEQNLISFCRVQSEHPTSGRNTEP
jgi:hypothetical protein